MRFRYLFNSLTTYLHIIPPVVLRYCSFRVTLCKRGIAAAAAVLSVCPSVRRICLLYRRDMVSHQNFTTLKLLFYVSRTKRYSSQQRR